MRKSARVAISNVNTKTIIIFFFFLTRGERVSRPAGADQLTYVSRLLKAAARVPLKGTPTLHRSALSQSPFHI